MKLEASLLLMTRQTGFGSLLPLTGCYAYEGQRGKAGSGQAAALRWSGRRSAPTALRPEPEARGVARHKQSSGLFVSGLRASVSWPVAKLTALTSFAAFKQAATSQFLMRAARAATSPALLGAPQARCDLPEPRFAASVAVFETNTTSPCRDATQP